jgi:hypothetical protein
LNKYTAIEVIENGCEFRLGVLDVVVGKGAEKK